MQLEAEQIGKQKSTLKYLNHHPLITIIIFTLVVASGMIWSEVIVAVLSKYVFNTQKEKLEPWMWIIIGISITGFIYLIIRYVVRIPVTAAYSL